MLRNARWVDINIITTIQKLYSMIIERLSYFFLTSSLKKYVFYNLLINNILYLFVT